MPRSGRSRSGWRSRPCDRESLVLPIADRELNELRHDRPRAWFEYLDKLIRLGVPRLTINGFAEIKAVRDPLVHNSGVVNRVYLDKAPGSPWAPRS